MTYPARTKYYDSWGHICWDEEMDKTKTVLVYEKDAEKRRANITINRPEKLNCLEGADLHEMWKIVEEVEADDDVKCVVIKGAGPCFTSGYSAAMVGFFHGVGRGLPGERRAPQRTKIAATRWNYGPRGTLDRWRTCLKPTILQAHSYCLGWGYALALCSDFVIASEDAVFGHPAWRWVGSAVDPWLAWSIFTLGPKATRKMTLLGKYIEAEEALKLGLVTEVVPRDRLEQRVNEYAEACALMGLDALVVGKAVNTAYEDILGCVTAISNGPISNAVVHGIRFEPGEWNYFRERRAKEVEPGKWELHELNKEREERFAKIPGFSLPKRPNPYSKGWGKT